MEITVTKNTLSKGLKLAKLFIKEAIITGGQEETKTMAEVATKLLQIRMEEYTPKRPRKYPPPGKLGTHIVYDIQRKAKGFDNVFFAFVDESKAPYAPFVEKGHHSFEGYWFMAETYQVTAANLEANMASHLRKSLSKIKI